MSIMDLGGQRRGVWFSRSLGDLGWRKSHHLGFLVTMPEGEKPSTKFRINHEKFQHLSLSLIAQWPELVTWTHSKHKEATEVPSREGKQTIWCWAWVLTTHYFVGGVEEFPLQEHKHLNRQASGILEVCSRHVHTAILLSHFLSPSPPTRMWCVPLLIPLRSKHILKFLFHALCKAT